MNKISLLILVSLIILTGNFSNAQPNIQWQKSFGGSGSDFLPSIEKTSDGGYIIVGVTESHDSDVTVQRGNGDYWIVKIDASGSMQWQRSFGGTDKDWPYSIQQTSDEGYIIGGYSISNDVDITGNHGQEDYWILKISSAGILQWQKSLGGSNTDIAYSIQQIFNGGYIVAGSTKSIDGDVTFHHGGISVQTDCWIVCLDSIGSIVWQKSLGGSSSDVGYSIKQTTDGGFIVAGQSSSTNGDVTGLHGTNADYWIIKLSSLGSIEWQKTLGGTKNEIAFSIELTLDGGYIVAGNAASSDGDVSVHYGSYIDYDYWVVKLDSAGSIKWEKAYGGTSLDMANSIQQTTDGGYVVTGYTNSNDWDLTGLHGINFDYDYWIVKLSDVGVIQWQKVLGGTKDDVGVSVRETSDNGFIVSGNSRSNNRDVTVNKGASDFWIVKLSPLVSVNEIQNSKFNFQIFPNPFSDETYFSFQITSAKNLTLKINDIEGREIINKCFTNLSVGTNDFMWDGTNSSRCKVDDGVYFVSLVGDNFIETKRVVVTKADLK